MKKEKNFNNHFIKNEMNTINKINAYLRERGLLNEEETKKQENSPTEIQVRFIKKVETAEMEDKEIEANEEEE